MKIVRPDFTPRLLEAHTRPMLPRTDGPVPRRRTPQSQAERRRARSAGSPTNLAHDLGGEVSFVDAKDHAAIPAPVEMLDAAAAGAHIVFTGTGD